MNRPRIYVAGPISKGNVTENVHTGIAAGLMLLEAGYAPFIPHLSHLVNPRALQGTEDYEKWLELDLSFISVCDALLRLPGESAGADKEAAYAKQLNIPIYYSVEDVIRQVFPKGDARFHSLLGQLGRLHDRKQADYGGNTDPFANVRASAEWGVRPWVGALLRLSDKIRRLQRFAERGTLANESAMDSMMDIAVYSLIALILYQEGSK